MTASQEIGWIDDDAKLARLVAALEHTSIAAVDTEFVREKTYYPQLCLIQIGTGDQVACVDCLADLDLRPLHARLFDPSFTWVLHSARQDLEVVFRLAGRMPPRLIDTQVAAALTGYPPQVGLEGLLKRTLDVELGESFARTDWSRRPLPEAALRYALDDVRHLLAAWERLDSELGRLGRREWLREDSERMLAEHPVADATAVWSRLKGAHGLNFASQCAALALVRWRENAAQRSDRPRRWLLADDALLAIAAALPRDAEALAAVAESKFIMRSAPVILAAIESRNDAELQAEVRANAIQAIPDKTLVKSLQERVRQHAATLGIEPEILATKRDLVGVALNDPPLHLRTGWRAKELAPIFDGVEPAEPRAI
ncbi:MAG TPA: HRDC domain-containing protein [Gammaproteobacteria bacterium]|nr:HRDC domain-containing protein [Gammaproteobacteria bacterium]